jgi:RHS repeat-associated protein
MDNETRHQEDLSSADSPSSDFFSAPPKIELPKGGGAIKGIGEKFTSNPVTGTGSMSISLPLSAGRSGFSPKLSLSYNSGAGNGAFGLGWKMALPAISRKTDKGIPRYRDQEESDVFMLAGAEDLVPVLTQSDDDHWQFEIVAPRRVGGVDYTIRRYRPRTEGSFARIERWTSRSDSTDCFWRTISQSNVTSWYGRTAESRISDPCNPSHIFSWLLCESYDDKGNVIVYGYQKENSYNVETSQLNEKNRNNQSRSANRYLKRICYGNHRPYSPKFVASDPWPSPPGSITLDASQNWLFEVVLDYGEHSLDVPSPSAQDWWQVRPDPFSSHRSGFEVRNYRLCQRVLMFHHFPDEAGVGANCLVSSMDFDYEPRKSEHPASSYSLMSQVTQSGYKRNQASYLKKSLPSVEFDYSQAVVGKTIQQLATDSLENLPVGVDAGQYQWIDLDGEGLSGVLTEQGGGWFYKPNQSTLTRKVDKGQVSYQAQLAPLQSVASLPSGGLTGSTQRHWMDLEGSGSLDLVELKPPMSGFYRRAQQDWQSFREFKQVPNLDWNDPNLKWIDLTGDGRADLLISEQDAFTWHGSMLDDGFDQGERIAIPTDEESGPRVVFSDTSQSLFLADFCGDGLTDIVRIRNGEICYWPNQGYGKFGDKVSMDSAPWFDHPDQFDPQRIRLVDIDGSGAVDLIYLGSRHCQFWLNRFGNGWGEAQNLPNFPLIVNVATVAAVDLLGNGTACLVWSSPLENQSMVYIELMAEGKPDLMIGTRNNLGAETRIHYVPSTYFYLKDKQAGKPWLTTLPFPVHVVERVEVYDHISRNRFVTRSAYHHGFYDGLEREFRGFAMVERWDTEEFAALNQDGLFPRGDNIEESSHVPPVLTRTWFHTGVSLGGHQVSEFFAGLLDDKDKGEYYREPGLSDHQARQMLLTGTLLPSGLTHFEEREACRALKGSMLRQEIYALDRTDKEAHPYSVIEFNHSVQLVQPKSHNQHAVFFSHANESISYQYERNPNDPRTSHTIALDVDELGNVLKKVAVVYGRRKPDMTLSTDDQRNQSQSFITYVETQLTNGINLADSYRTPLPCQNKNYELTGYASTGPAERYRSIDFVEPSGGRLKLIVDNELNHENKPTTGKQSRLTGQTRILYRPDDFGRGSANQSSELLPLTRLESLALTGETYKQVFTAGVIKRSFQRKNKNGIEYLLPNPAEILAGQGNDQGGYIDLDKDGGWWLPSGRVFYSTLPNYSPSQERQYAAEHFFMLRRFRDPFGQSSTVIFDKYDLLGVENRDQLDNRVTIGERDRSGSLSKSGNDYRVLQPWLVMDANRNRTAVAFDTLGMVVGTAVMGKPEDNFGDSLQGFITDLNDEIILQHLAKPMDDPHSILQKASTRMVYDLFAYQRTKTQKRPSPSVDYTLIREQHQSDLGVEQSTKIQTSFSYSDGFGQQIQEKMNAEASVIESRDNPEEIIVTADGEVPMTSSNSSRWVGSGWSIFNNKGKVVRQYEPFFTGTHLFEFDLRIGASKIRCYDPSQRIIATLNPNHTWTKDVVDPWRQISWDVNDTLLINDPSQDVDVGGFFRRLRGDEYLPSWYQQRRSGELGRQEKLAAQKTELHANTPTISYFDSIGRTFLRVNHNRFKHQNSPVTEEFYQSRVVFDFNGNPLETIDAMGRVIYRYHYDLLGNQIYQASMEQGERWDLSDLAGNSIRSWNSRGNQIRNNYDRLRRPSESYLTQQTSSEKLIERIVYGESQANPEEKNLRTEIAHVFDQAGIASNNLYDFKGNLLSSQRQLATEYKETLDWSEKVPLNAEIYSSDALFDALNRSIQTTAIDKSVIKPQYSEANLLQSVEVYLQGDKKATPFIVNIDYDAKGQRKMIEYGNGASSHYQYDPLTFRLTNCVTQRNANNFKHQSSQTAFDNQLQDLQYIYDPVGNISHIHDSAQQSIFFRNQQVDPSYDYDYDAIYRLIDATGREHLGQGGAALVHLPGDSQQIGLQHPGDGHSMARYFEKYIYDAVGNILSMQHRGRDTGLTGWRRDYSYSETSQLEDNKYNNRLTSTQVGESLGRYQYNGSAGLHGNMTSMPHLPLMQWDYRDHLRASARQVINNGTPETTWYVYDTSGQRVRKVTERQSSEGEKPTRIKERIYLTGFETYREYKNDGTELKFERQTLNLLQGTALIETRSLDKTSKDKGPAQLIRYQLGNHLGSSSLELDQQAQIISYEEYTPFGSTSYQAVRNQTETRKRYRNTGKEKDEENDLYYHGARYYAAWLGRWTAADPAGLVDGPNLYAFARNAPNMRVDGNGMGSTLFEEIENAIDAATGGAYRRFRVKLNIDEIVAVKGNKAGGRAGSPSDPANKQMLDSRNNSVTKSNRIGPEPHRRPQTSFKNAPDEAANRLLTGQFDEIDEVRRHANDATEAVTPGRRTNASLWGRIRSNPVIVRAMNAIGVDLGTGTLFNPPGVNQFPDGDSVHLTPNDADVNPRNGQVVEGPNTDAARSRRSQRHSGGGRRGGGKSGGGTLGKIAAVGIGLYVLFDTGDVYAAAQTANPLASITDNALSEEPTVESTASSIASDIYGLTPLATVEWVVFDLLGPRGDNIYSQDLADRAIAEGRNPFCAQCHGPGGALDPNNDWNSRGRFESFEGTQLLTSRADLNAIRGFIQGQQ